MELEIHKLSENPKFQKELNRLHQEGWPEFMRKDEKADLYWSLLMTTFAEYQMILSDPDDNVLAVGNSIPIDWDGTVNGLPSGWDGAIEKGALGYEKGIKPNTLSALAIVVEPKIQGKGLSHMVIKGVKDTAKGSGLNHFIVPLRPSLKSRYPLIPIEKYIEWKNEHGLPFDPWLRTHYKVGGKVLAIAPQSMIIKGTISEWEQWTKMRFPESGDYIVPGALTPVQIDYENNVGQYIEPNVWVHHEL